MDLLELQVVILVLQHFVPLLRADCSHPNLRPMRPVIMHRVHITLVRFRHRTLVMCGYVWAITPDISLYLFVCVCVFTPT